MASKPWDQEMASDEDVRRRKLSRRNRGSISTSGLAKNASLRISPLPRESRRHFDVWQCQCATPRPTSVVGLSGFPGSPRSSVGYRSANWTRNPISARLAPTLRAHRGQVAVRQARPLPPRPVRALSQQRRTTAPPRTCLKDCAERPVVCPQWTVFANKLLTDLLARAGTRHDQPFCG